MRHLVRVLYGKREGRTISVSMLAWMAQFEVVSFLAVTRTE